MKIIVVKRDKIGDMLLTTPMLRSLREALPQAEIHVLANDYNAWVLNNNPDVDRLWVYGRARQGGRLRWAALLGQAGLAAALRLARFDVAIVGNGGESPRAIGRALWLGAKRTIAYCERADLRRRLTDPLDLPPPSMHETERLVGLLRPLDVRRTPSFPVFAIGHAALAQATAWRRENGLEDVPFVVIGLGARREKKQPTAEQIVRWSSWLKRKFGYATVLTWTPGGKENSLYPGDDGIAEAVLERQPDFIYPYRSRPIGDPAQFGAALQGLMGLLWQASGSIFPDSGLMHFAAASPGGVLGLFADVGSSASPDEWGPRGRKTQIVVAERSISELADETVFIPLARLLEQ